MNRARPDGFRKYFARAKFEVGIDFDEDISRARLVTYHTVSRVLNCKLDWPGLTSEEVLAFLEELRFEDGELGLHFAECKPSSRKTTYRAAGFSDNHHAHGWACAFQGDGHGRLASRRWLDQPMWRVLRGGYIQTPGERELPHADVFRRAVYVETEKLLKVVVCARSVPEAELFDAVELRALKRAELGPVVNIAYVFLTEAEARAHLHELWLRELECRAIIDGKEGRLDDTYVPAPVEPVQWVRDLERRG